MSGGAGRYAPSPSSDLHLGNLRTAVLAYLAARHDGLAFRMRLEDLDDRCRPEFAERQLADLAALGLTWDGPVMRQSERRVAYEAAIERLSAQGLVYECFCSRRDILEAARAPHHPPGAYPGTCRRLSAAERSERRRLKEPAIRLRAQAREFAVTDRLAGESLQPVDDFILRRADGVAAYNLAVVVDDAAQGVTQVTRGDDLLSSSGRQGYLASLLGLPAVTYFHVPLVYGAHGRRLAKRDAALAGAALFERCGGPAGVLDLIAASIGLGGEGPGNPTRSGGRPEGVGNAGGLDGIGGVGEMRQRMDRLVKRFDWGRLVLGAWTV